MNADPAVMDGLWLVQDPSAEFFDENEEHLWIYTQDGELIGNDDIGYKINDRLVSDCIQLIADDQPEDDPTAWDVDDDVWDKLGLLVVPASDRVCSLIDGEETYHIKVDSRLAKV